MSLKAHVFRQSKVSTQSGKAKTKKWFMVFCSPDNKPVSLWKEAMMGWTSTHDTYNQVNISFHSLEEALAYAKQHSIVVEEIRDSSLHSKISPKSYMDNFRFNKPKLFG